MKEPDNYGYEYQDTTELPIGGQAAAPVSPSQYTFSPGELQVLRECNIESFYRRSMPLATLLGAGTYVAVQQGYLKANARFGAIPKITLAVMAGYFIGKLSYQQACAEKLMALPGSYIGQLLRERRDGKIGGATTKQRQNPTMFGAKPGDIYSDAGPGSSLDLDTDRPIFSEDAYRPTNSENPNITASEGITTPPITYEELRQKNRGDYANTRQDPYRTDTVPIVTRPRPAPAPTSPRTNKYGDITE